jgi:hypothetical protein
MTKKELINSKIKAGWHDCCDMNYGYGSRRWYLKKGRYEVTYNRYGECYNSPSVHDLNTIFKAIEDFEDKDEGAMKIVNEFVKSKDLSFLSETLYGMVLRLIAYDLMITDRRVVEL